MRALFEARLSTATWQYHGYFLAEEDLIGKRAWLRAKLLGRGDWSGIIP